MIVEVVGVFIVVKIDSYGCFVFCGTALELLTFSLNQDHVLRFEWLLIRK